MSIPAQIHSVNSCGTYFNLSTEAADIKCVWCGRTSAHVPPVSQIKPHGCDKCGNVSQPDELFKRMMNARILPDWSY